MENEYVIGVDFGSDSVRALLIDISNGACVAFHVVGYSRWSRGMYCDSSINQYRQHPLDYIESLESVIVGCLTQVPREVVDGIIGISFDTTASTPVLTDRSGTPLALLPQYTDNPDAMFVLWKDHTAINEAEEINRASKLNATDYTRYCGGSYSCEWVWAKMLHCLRSDESLCLHAYSWVEHCDWISALLTGDTTPETISRSRCAAGHKAMWHESWGGLPPMDFFQSIDPLYLTFNGHLYTNTHENGHRVGFMSESWSKRFGINHTVAVGIGAIDCHIGAIGAGIKPNTIVKVVGTSTCDIAITPPHCSQTNIEGICGQVLGSVLPGMVGYEAGQAAFGDLFAWFKRLLCWGRNDLSDDLLQKLTLAASELPLRNDSPVTLDWFNGRRSPDSNPCLKGMISDLSLSSTAPEIFASIVESCCFGSRVIMEHLIDKGLTVNEVVAIGGIAVKSSYVMQTLSDILQRPVVVLMNEQTCALGAAICAAVAAGAYHDFTMAQQAMCVSEKTIYHPNKQRALYYSDRFKKYRQLCCFENAQKNIAIF